MSVQDLLLKIKRRDNSFYSGLYYFCKHAQTFRLPSCRPLYSLLYYERSTRHTAAGMLKKIFYYEPLLRARCVQVGERLALYDGIPCIEGNLQIYLGNGVRLHGMSSLSAARVHENPTLVVGDDSYIGYQVVINVGERVRIGKHCYIASNCWIADYDGHPIDPVRRHNNMPLTPDDVRPIEIEDDVWLGAGVIVLKGVTIGRGSVIGAGSVVTHDIPAYSVAVGNPARVLKQLTPAVSAE